ncbi:MAG: preprotein translocase subunit SecA [Cytophagales bacterium]|nr:preprotein translocase subunit SecA [Cytophagales bacterium]
MLSFITKSIAKVFGTKSERDIKAIAPYVERIKEEFARLAPLSDDQLRQKSHDLRVLIQSRLEETNKDIADLKAEALLEETDAQTKEQLFAQIDELEKEQNKIIEAVLLEILPEAFAIVKETARRWKENGKLTVTASDMDRAIAAKRKGVDIEGQQAIWHNKWLAAGNEVTWEMVHYDVQLLGGTVIHQGKIAEMATGEGKTLVATLPVFLNALAGRGVHIVTVNDYLAKRDSEWMGPLYEFHGLTVDCIDKHEPNSDQRRNAYLADVTFGTNNEFGFDYLRDNMARSPEELVQRKHHYAIVDEVDSVLVDDARTPLIISGPVSRSDEQQFYDLKPRVLRLFEAQKKLCGDLLVEAKKKLTANPNDKEGALALFRAHRGLPTSKPLIKYLGEQGIKNIMQKTENSYLEDNQKLMPEADKILYFTIDEKNNSVDLTDKGLELIISQGEETSFFVLPDIGFEMAQIENDKSISDQSRQEKIEALIKDYSDKSERIHTVNQLLKAYTLFEKEVDYIIVDGKVKIVDEQTGRVLEGRRYSDGLHQAIEAKENVKVEDATQTYATITLQNYFRMYHKLAGMTGTAETEAGEFWEIYKLDVVVVPTHQKMVREDKEDKIFKTVREKYNAVVEEIVALTAQGRPVLVGTTSVEISELVSRMLKMRNIKHQVLNAKYHQKEAEIVAEAGKPGTVTIATNMAGRGTDIKLAPESKAAGGLAIIGTERHESRRVDRQLRGRAGRQGDPGSTQFYVSLDDNLMRLFGSDRIAVWMDRLGLKEGEVIEHSMITSSIERAQKKVEENNFGIRKRLLDYDDVMNSQREVVYTKRRNALFGDRLQLDILNMIYDVSAEVVSNAKPGNDYEKFVFDSITNFGKYPDLKEDDFKRIKSEEMTDFLYDEMLKSYKEKNKAIAAKSFQVIRDLYMTRGAAIENIVVPFSDGKTQLNTITNLKKAFDTQCGELIHSREKYISLAIIDNLWKEHLREMDELKQSVQNAVYEQKDPLLIYKMEAFNLFKRLNGEINTQIISFLFKSDLPADNEAPLQEARAPRVKQTLRENKEEARSLLNSGQQPGAPEVPQEKIAPVKSQKIAGRNDRVTVQYSDGNLKKDIKYKSVEADVMNNRCVVVEINGEAV